MIDVGRSLLMCETLVRLADEYECQYRTSVKSAPKTNGRRTNMPGIADKRANRALIRLATSQARVYAGELRARVEALIAERHVNDGASSRDVERVVNSNSMLAMPGLTHDERARILLGTLPGESLVVVITDRVGPSPHLPPTPSQPSRSRRKRTSVCWSRRYRTGGSVRPTTRCLPALTNGRSIIG